MAEAAWKPWAAGLLVAAAFAMMARNLLPMLHGSGPDATPALDRPTAATSMPSTDQVGASDSPVPPVDGTDSAELSGWIADPDRDPFGTRPRRKAHLTNFDQPGGRSPGTRGRSQDWKTRSRVSAMVWGQGRMALVDGVAVGVGDSLAQGRILDIGFYGVLVRRAGSDTILRFPEGRKP